MAPHTTRTALITGATAGLGLAYARQLARSGYALVLVARDAERLATTAEGLRAESGAHVEVIAADLATDDGVSRVVERLRAGTRDPAQFIELLVNNAGFGTKGTLVSGDGAEQEAMVRLHVLAVHRLTDAALRPMLARSRGAIITVSSVASYLTSPGNVTYCATKAYQRFAMEALAPEVARQGVYVQAFCPGFTRTEFHARAHISTSPIPGLLWMDAEEAVAASLAALAARRPTTVIPGRLNRLIVAMLSLMPRWVRARGTRRDAATRKSAGHGEAPRLDAPPREEPLREAPPREAPVLDAPQRDAPQRDAPQREEPRREEPPRAEPRPDGPSNPTAPNV